MKLERERTKKMAKLLEGQELLEKRKRERKKKQK